MAPHIEACKTMQVTDRRGLMENPRRPAAKTKPSQETQIPTTTMKLARLISSVLIGSSLTLTWPAAAADAPTVDSIMVKHIQAMGGKEAMGKFHSRSVQFKMESETLGSSEGEVLAQAPDRLRSHIDLGATGIIDEGFDGKVAWVKNPWQGLRAKTGDELAKVKRDAQFHPELNYKSLYPDLAYKGIEKVGDEEAWLLESKPTATSKETFWFSTKTALLIRQVSQYEGPTGAVNLNILPQDYKTFDGLKFPGAMKMKFSSAGQDYEFSLKFLNVKHNVEIDAAKFAKPAE
jgi:outer membrane lipoprotein-sorting protein